MTELHEVAEDGPDAAVAASLQRALTELRERADAVAAMSSGVDQVEAAEAVAADAARLDEQLGSAARGDGG